MPPCYSTWASPSGWLKISQYAKKMTLSQLEEKDEGGIRRSSLNSHGDVNKHNALCSAFPNGP